MRYVPSGVNSLKLTFNMILRKLSVSTALVATALFIGGAALAVHVTTRPASSSRATSAPEAATAKGPAAPGAVTVHAAGRGKPLFNFLDGRQMAPAFKVSNAASQALQNANLAFGLDEGAGLL